MATNGEEPGNYEDRLKRIRFLRKVIWILIAAACLIPTSICIILAIRYDKLNRRLDQAVDELAWYESEYGESALAMEKGVDASLIDEDDAAMSHSQADTSVEAVTDVAGVGADAQNVNSDTEGNPGEDSQDIMVNAQVDESNSDGMRRVYITFDDGPSSQTDTILDILNEYEVKATFFVTGKADSKYTDIYKRIVDEGHTLGMHSYSHRYSELYESLEGFQTDLHQLRTFLYETTGAWSTIYRFPGGSSNTVSKVDMKELINYLALENITYYDWNVASGDDRNGITKELIVSNVMTGVPKFENAMILLHDASDKQATVDALPEIIEQVQAMDNTVIVPITDETLPVQHISNSQ